VSRYVLRATSRLAPCTAVKWPATGRGARTPSNGEGIVGIGASDSRNRRQPAWSQRSPQRFRPYKQVYPLGHRPFTKRSGSRCGTEEVRESGFAGHVAAPSGRPGSCPSCRFPTRLYRHLELARRPGHVARTARNRQRNVAILPLTLCSLVRFASLSSSVRPCLACRVCQRLHAHRLRRARPGLHARYVANAQTPRYQAIPAAPSNGEDPARRRR
jgi:hypothetical protein